ncbi:hypothetical protein [Nocardia niwae]|uniref:hypothetical protein n=1 Tax=Nocardia niwae TaxID=626084 RepID=UPI0033C5DB60
MSKAAKMETKPETCSVSSAVPKTDGKSWSGWYKLHNDLPNHLLIYRRDTSGVPRGLLALAPGATSDQYENGELIFIRHIEINAAQMIEWKPDLSFTIWYQYGGTATPNKVNNMSSF